MAERWDVDPQGVHGLPLAETPLFVVLEPILYVHLAGRRSVDAPLALEASHRFVGVVAARSDGEIAPGSLVLLRAPRSHRQKARGRNELGVASAAIDDDGVERSAELTRPRLP